eukprot:TRINITY_DN13254_c0_g1_i2.p1 TRINITY_DN13254_c0_g1~~TRINITY_DN13254_c0_g1_i2.p1  ORF type:complete len:168 (-),score=41.40 TRINITY_DN13254_c0_g1_i2:31-534(-)
MWAVRKIYGCEQGLRKESRLASESNEAGQLWLQRRQLATQQQAILLPLADKIKKEEESKSGLVIIKATYGTTLVEREAEIVQALKAEYASLLEVTVALQALVRDSAIKLPAGKKGDVVGFCEVADNSSDPAYLCVWYKYHTIEYRAVFRDDQPVILPDPSHEKKLYS